MKIDLEQLYYGVVAFCVFLVAFFALEFLADQLPRLLVVSNVPLNERRPPILPPPTLTAPAPQATLTPEQKEQVQFKEFAGTNDFELRMAKEEFASAGAIALIAIPIWFFHWRRWRALTRASAATLYQVYGYALMLIVLITSIMRAGGASGAILRWVFGVADLSTRYESFSFARDLAGNLLGVLIALIAWWYHWASVRAEKG